MRLFRTHRESARMTNRTLGWFFLAALALTVIVAFALAGRYALGLW